jgi:hypothetical protein
MEREALLGGVRLGGGPGSVSGSGGAPLCGAPQRYLIEGEAGVLGFSAAAWRLAPRDAWIGWDDAARAKGLQLVGSNSRFLILPGGRMRMFGATRKQACNLCAGSREYGTGEHEASARYVSRSDDAMAAHQGNDLHFVDAVPEWACRSRRLKDQARCTAADRKPPAAPMPAIAYKAPTTLRTGTPCAHSMNGDKPMRAKECPPGQKAGEGAGPGPRCPPPRHKGHGLTGGWQGRRATWRPPQASEYTDFITVAHAENVAKAATQQRHRTRPPTASRADPVME